MSAAVTVLVLIGIALTLALAVGFGLDALGGSLLALIAAFGALGIAVARRARSGRVAPRACHECGGVVSSHAPYCKHCGAPRRAER